MPPVLPGRRDEHRERLAHRRDQAVADEDRLGVGSEVRYIVDMRGRLHRPTAEHQHTGGQLRTGVDHCAASAHCPEECVHPKCRLPDPRVATHNHLADTTTSSVGRLEVVQAVQHVIKQRLVKMAHKEHRGVQRRPVHPVRQHHVSTCIVSLKQRFVPGRRLGGRCSRSE